MATGADLDQGQGRGPDLAKSAERESVVGIAVSHSVGAAIRAAQQRSSVKHPAAERDEPKAEVALARGAEDAGKQQGLSPAATSVGRQPDVQDIAAEQSQKAARQLAQVAGLYEQHVDRMLHARGQSMGGASLDTKTDMLEVSTASLGNLPKVPDFIGHQAQRAQSAEMARV